MTSSAVETASPDPGSEGETVRLDDGRTVIIRDMRPEDDALYPAFAQSVTAEDHRRRFFAAAGGLSRKRAWALTHFDRREARGFIAIDPRDGAMMGAGRVHRETGGSGEFAVIVRSDLKGLGLGRHLMEKVLDGAAVLGLDTLWGLILRENTGMIALATDLGFAIRSAPGETGIVLATRQVEPLRLSA